MKNGTDALNRNVPKENETNIIDEKTNLNKLQSLEINTSNLKSRNKFYRLMNSQLALQCPKAKMYLPTKAYSELDYHK